MRLDLAYDGTGFSGWQVQPGVPTVQGELEAALARILGRPTRLHGAGRTDAGVHARGQVASFETDSGLDPTTLRRALNSQTPVAIVVHSVRDEIPGFHARYSAEGKRYLYRIRMNPLPDPFDLRYAWHRRAPLALAAMREAAASLLGQHDFSSFRAAGCAAASPVRRIDRLELRHDGGALLEIVVEGDGFLRHMVRNVVGTLVEVGRGRWAPSRVAGVLAARDRSLAGPTAPAHGLFLDRVRYGADGEG